MKRPKSPLVALALILLTCLTYGQSTIDVDVCIYGGTSSGIMAAYAVQKQGKTAILIEPGNRLGGMSSGGLGYTDIGNKYAITGLALDFYRRVGQHYGAFEQWIFEPSVAEEVFQGYVDRGGFQVLYQRRLKNLSKVGTEISEIVVEDSNNPSPATDIVVRAKMFIDCGYEGDLMAKAGVAFTVGRESSAVYNESLNGVQLRNNHQFPNGIDPYVIPGQPSSGLLWGISNSSLAPNGTGDNKVQAYNFRICLTSDPQNKIDITEPAGYDPSRYELLLRLMAAQPTKTSLNNYFIWSSMPNSKTDINNKGGFSTDMIGMNWDYPNASYDQRKQILQEHEAYTKGLLYFLGHDPRVPAQTRNDILRWGYPKDEYTDNGNWTPQLYIREARRMVGNYVMTQADCKGLRVASDGIALGAYNMDSHHCQRLVVNGQVKNEGCVEVAVPGPYPIAYNSIVPKASDCTNILVPVCLSASHIAYGSIRMEPVFMELGQAAATASVMAIDGDLPVQGIDVSALQNRLESDPLADGSTADIIVDNDDNAGVSVVGNWTVETKGGFGPTYLLNQGTSPGTVRFTPNILAAGTYNVYSYFAKRSDMSNFTRIKIYDGQTERIVLVNKDDISVTGQTSGEWAPLGTFDFPIGTQSYVEISTDNADGTIIADAIVWVPDSASTVDLRSPDNPTGVINGVKYEYYEGVWSSLPDFENIVPLDTGLMNSIDLSMAREDDYAFRYSGFIDIPSDGIYTFYLTSDEGSQFFIGDSLVIDNDGLHVASEASGTYGLKAGKHAFVITYFEHLGTSSLSFEFEGPSMSRQVVPNASLFSFEPPATSDLRTPENPADALSGLNYYYYEGTWTSLPDFSSLSPVKSGTVSNALIYPRERDDNFGFKFSGYIDVPADGEYTFYTTSDEGSQLLIGNSVVVDNDGLHSSLEASGSIGLKQGKHSLTVLYFEGTGSQSLTVRFSGPDIQKQKLPSDILYHVVEVAPEPEPGDNLREPDNPINPVAGLDYAYYEGDWTSLPDFSSLTPVSTGTVAKVLIYVRERDDYFGLNFSGYVDVPTDGEYTFYLTSDEGSQLLIGDSVVVDHDGLHTASQASGVIGLKQGLHSISIRYFERTGSQSLVARYAGPGISKQTIPGTVLFREVSAPAFATSLLSQSENTADIGKVMTFPNPARNEVTLGLDVANGSTVEATVTSIYGGMIKSQTWKDVPAGYNEFHLDLREVPNGIYYVNIRTSTELTTTRLVVGKE